MVKNTSARAALTAALCLAGAGGVRCDQNDARVGGAVRASASANVSAQATQIWSRHAFQAAGRRGDADAPFLGARGDAPPFSFSYGGVPSSKLLPGWKRGEHTEILSDRVLTTIDWEDPATGLRVRAHVTAWRDFPGIDWVLRFENEGTRDTPILEDIRAGDMTLATSPDPLLLDQIRGDTTDQNSFLPIDGRLAAGQETSFGPPDGRPSTRAFPFFGLEHGGKRCFVALGWTGHWKVSIRRDPSGVTHLGAGLERTHLLLHPGESIRTPRILLMDSAGDRIQAHNAFRRLLLAHYTPRIQGDLPTQALGVQMFNRWSQGQRPEWGTEAGQIQSAAVNRKIGANTLWLDAGWFPGGFPQGVGNWSPDPARFPNGLSPVADAAHRNGLRFLLWYEPERAAFGTETARQHPDYLLTAGGDGSNALVNLGNPAARAWLTGLMNRQITAWKLDCWRSDFNIDPLPYWKAADAPDREGYTESKYVEGLYAFWDDLRARHPHLLIDNCASGGRRIDLESISRAVVQTRSDTEGTPGRADWDQSQTYGLSLFLPLHGAFAWSQSPYDVRSAATGGYLGEWDLLDPRFDQAAARAALEEVKADAPDWSGDYYPLTPWPPDATQWVAWQMDRPDRHDGVIFAFRHADSAVPTLLLKPHGLTPGARYAVTQIDERYLQNRMTMTAAELSRLRVTIDRPRGSLIVRYQQIVGPP